MTNQQTNRGKRRFASRAVVAALMALAAVAAGGMNAARAQTQAAQPPVRNSEIDHATNQWLALQRSNTAAAPARPMLGAEANLAYKRYLESFNSKIPDFYGSSIGQASGGSSQGGLAPQN
ncbi:DUF3613 domain-containing protein [Paraburkholderia phenazinium]|uniref:DUF3613 domain-containing protein n=1 Tax=Paraburkholderia phenazinium TaxID=60549 RepID=A0A1G8ELK7_9BURK|nr:DUF3613 domain-containing protein [Paraburkholderia phenazinium]SDH70785.1 Protein of unknown function [Paraburkholderia phenazinium]